MMTAITLKVCRRLGGINLGMPNVPARLLCAVVCRQPGACRLTFIAAVLCMVIGHIFKVKRWGLFISVYEEPLEANLLNAMTLGHTANAIFSFRFGDIIRIIWAGRKLKNGYSFSLATVIVDLYIDVITVGAMFFGLSAIRKGGERLLQIAHFYMCAFLVIVLFTLLCIFFRKQLKKIIRIIAGIFNEKIEFRMLYVSYLCIASLKDIIKNINKVKFIGYSACMWICYVASYVIFAESVQRYGYYYSTSDVFTELFSGSSLYNIAPGLVPFWGAYLLLPLAVCWGISVIGDKYMNMAEHRYHAVLPQMNQTDRLAFLKTYYDDENRERIRIYLEMNKDVTIVEDHSSGSNASTVLVMRPDGNLFYRKYAFDEEGHKLQEQIQWIEKHQADIPLPIIIGKRNESNYVMYDMRCYTGIIDLFRYIHMVPVNDSWLVLKKALDDIGEGLHGKHVKAADPDTIRKYVDGKVNKNIRFMLDQDKYIRSLELYSKIYVNGIELPTLHSYGEILGREHLEKIFEHDTYCDIHGDFTVENIICLSDSEEVNRDEYKGKIRPETYYFIDPNTGNVHDSSLLDYGKLLQSLHGNYEFLMMVNSVKIEKDHVNFLITRSEAYVQLYNKYKEYLRSRFDKNEMLSIYYHEVVHWIRLIPYKIRKDEKLAV